MKKVVAMMLSLVLALGLMAGCGQKDAGKDSGGTKTVESLKIGQFSDVLEAPMGYEIILLQDKRDPMVAPYANVRESILQRIRQEVQAKAREQYAWKLAKEVGVKVEMPELKGAVPESAL